MPSEAAAFKKDWQKRQRKSLEAAVDCAYLYAHLEADSGEPFYIGMGDTFTRPWDKKRSSKHKNRANKHGQITHVDAAPILTYDNALWWEVRWIKAFRDAGYDLVNLTEGGEGTKGFKWDNDLKERHRKTLNKPETVAKRNATNSSPELIELRSINTALTWEDEEIRASRCRGLKAALNTDEYREKRAVSDAKPEVIKRRSEANKAAQNKPETIEKKSAAAKAAHLRPETKAKHAAVNADPIVREKRSKSKRGDNHPSVKITEEQAISIINSLDSGKNLATKYGVSAATICDIQKGRSWKHLPRPNMPQISAEEKRRNAAIQCSSQGWETRRRNQLLKKGVE